MSLRWRAVISITFGLTVSSSSEPKQLSETLSQSLHTSNMNVKAKELDCFPACAHGYFESSDRNIPMCEIPYISVYEKSLETTVLSINPGG